MQIGKLTTRSGMNTRPDLDMSYSQCHFLYARILHGDRVVNIAAQSIVWLPISILHYTKTQNTDEFCQSASGNPDPVLISAHVPEICDPICFFSVCSTPTNNVVGFDMSNSEGNLTQQAIIL